MNLLRRYFHIIAPGYRMSPKTGLFVTRFAGVIESIDLVVATPTLRKRWVPCDYAQREVFGRPWAWLRVGVYWYRRRSDNRLKAGLTLFYGTSMDFAPTDAPVRYPRPCPPELQDTTPP